MARNLSHPNNVMAEETRNPSGEPLECPNCGAEMTTLEGEDLSLTQCPECKGVWIDAADLNKALLHNDLPGLESLGGRENLDEVGGQCPIDLADFVVIEGPGKTPLRYDACEVCGGIWLGDGARFKGEKVGDILEEVVEFYREFAK